MEYDGAQVGDEVCIVFGNPQERMFGVVKHMASAPGDSWIIHTMEGGIVHVLMFETLTVMRRKVPKP